jgi:hypothetical protein
MKKGELFNVNDAVFVFEFVFIVIPIIGLIVVAAEMIRGVV